MAEHSVVYGQSLAQASHGTPALSTVSETPNTWLLAADGTITVPLKSTVTQYPMLSMGYRIGGDRPEETFAFSTHASSGKTIAQLAKGGTTGVYEQLIAYVTASQRNVEGVHWIQGEADETFKTNPGVYFDSLVQLHADLIADIGAVTGQDAVNFITGQPATWSHYGVVPQIGIALLRAARELAGVWIVGGQYQLEYYSDGLHLTNVGYYHLGELHARAHEAVVAGTGWLPFAPASIDVQDDHLDAVFNVPTPPLLIDTTTIPEQTDYGFSLHGTAATITGVTLLDDTTVRIAIDQPITERGSALGYGVQYGNGSVGLGNLRDSDPTLSVYDSIPIPNWALQFRDDLGIDGPPPSSVWMVEHAYLAGADGALHEFTPYGYNITS